MKKSPFLFLLLVFHFGNLSAAELHIAVAANFATSMRDIAKEYEKKSAHKVKLSSGSSGKLYAQIKHGAPFDLFFAADTLRPQLLEQQGIAVAGSRFTYAIGQLILWSPQVGFVDARGEVLKGDGFHHLAIANPKLAPYGDAASAVLQHLGIWNTLRGRMVRGENIAQTFQFVQSGNAELGFVALSQLTKADGLIAGSYWLIPEKLYTPIEQQAVILSNKPAATEFMAFIQSREMRSLIQSHGYKNTVDKD